VASRRDFFTALRKPVDKMQQKELFVVRPPYAKSEEAFCTLCVTCESKACVNVCEEEIILIHADGTPMLNFTKKGCTFCEACANACAIDVLSLENQHTSEVINAKFVISTEACVAHHDVICFACKEPCIDDAILFNGLFNPVIDMDLCTGCGFCLSRCPTKAISYEAIALNRKEAI